MDGVRQLLVCDITGNNGDIVTALTGSIAKASRTVETIRVGSVDELYGESYNSKLEKATEADYVFTELPQLAALSEVGDRLAEQDMGLILLLKSNDYKRKKFNSFVEGFDDTEKAIVIIVK